MYCTNCGKELKEGWKVCPVCGNKIHSSEKDTDKVEQAGENKKDKATTCVESDMYSNAPKRPKKKMILLILITIVLIAGISTTFAYPKIQEYQQNVKNQQEADKVIKAISEINEESINVDAEKELNETKEKYDALTGEQKKLVSNYKNLENAYVILQNKKDEQVSQAIVKEIENINPEALTDTDTSIQALKDKFDALTESQKKLVTNSAKIDEYANIVSAKIAQKEETERQAAEAAKQEAEKQAAIDGAYNAVAGKSFHLRDAQLMVEFTTSGEFIYSVSSFGKESCGYSFSAEYGLNKDEMQYLVSVNINGVSYYFRYFTNGSINLAGAGEFEGWYDPY